MSPEERQMLTGLFDRIRGAAATPRDPEAEALISDAVKSQPYAPYLLAQAVLVQDQALQAANTKIQELETRLQDLQQNQPRQAPGAGGFLGGISSIFGGGNPPPRPAPPPQQGPWGQQGQQPSYAPPPPSGGPWGGAPAGGMGGGMMGGGMGGGMGTGMMGGGGSFLHGALGTAAGVAGGVLLADGIRGLFGAHNNPLGIGTGFSPGVGGGETIINNNYYDDNGGPDSADYGASDAPQDGYDDASYDDDSGSGDDGGSFDV